MQKSRVAYFESDKPKSLEGEINTFCDHKNFSLLNVSYSCYTNKENGIMTHAALLAYSFESDYNEEPETGETDTA